ncbi:DUF6025 family protein [Streptosporangium sp. NPDC006007]|uniref:DUF6025 family protein n=1 Tax=Streptosporangium sp. NPDC006007 TaxID=3154575 RepID=UPI0033AB1099
MTPTGLGRAIAEAIGDRVGGTELRAAIGNLESGRRVLDWIHLGKCDILLEDLISIIRSTAGHAPPRTGHLGDWTDISLSRSGLLDYNATICAEFGVGSPLLFDTTGTETGTLEQGDTIYLPGSTVQDGTASPLPLLVRDAAGLRTAPRTRSWFSPFVLTDADGPVELLSDLHRRRNATLDMPLDYVSRRLSAEGDRLRDLMMTALEAARRDPRRRETLTSSLFAGLVRTDAAPCEGAVRCTDSGYSVGGIEVSLDKLVDLALLPFHTLNDPRARAGHLSGEGFREQVVPMLSNMFLTILMVQARVHATRGTRPTGFDEHLHWGAIGMAGFPPRKKGYFEGSEYPRRSRPFFDHAHATGRASRVLFLVAPAVLFALLPRVSNPVDVELIDDLCRTVRIAADADSNAFRQVEIIERTVKEWHETHGARLSAFYRGQFNGRRSLTGRSEAPADSGVVVGDEFLRLTCRQASLIVGVLNQVNHA